jgi:PKD repeat protein
MLIVAFFVISFVVLMAVSNLAPKPPVDSGTPQASPTVTSVLPTGPQPTPTASRPPTPAPTPTPPTPTPPPTPTEPTSTPTPPLTPTPTPTPRSEPTPLPAAPSANFTGTIGADGLTVKWQDLSTGYITHWHWDFGDGTTASGQNPTHTYPGYGDYAVTVTVSGPGGRDSRTKELHLRVQPTANFTGTIGADGLTVKWQDLSTGYITHWHWDFGDGTTSNEQNPTHTYAAHGDYQVTLTVSWAGGRDSRTKVLHLRG